MTLVYLLLRANHGKEGLVKAALSKFPEISEIHEVFGRYDIIAKVETRNMEEFTRFIKNKVRIIEGVKSIETVFAAQEEPDQEN
jgi:DNA-binding Lrp family transcriptional regulator